MAEPRRTRSGSFKCARRRASAALIAGWLRLSRRATRETLCSVSRASRVSRRLRSRDRISTRQMCSIDRIDLTDTRPGASLGANAMIQPRRYEFEVEGVPIVGNLFLPAAAPARAVAVLTGPLTSVKEQAAGAYARALAERGIVALCFDHRTFGESGGQPRQLESPFAKVRDIQGAVSALSADRRVPGAPLLGVGVCVGGGYMARAVAEDDRFRGFAAVAGYFSSVTEQTLERGSHAIARAGAA